MLEAVDLTRRISKREYRKRLPPLQVRLHQLQRACYDAGLATVVLFEGWDAAGKGSSIRKLTERLEPRGFSLHAIREPRTSETLLPWLWRFWLKLPTWGQMAIFDRSWYGRVLVERVEGSASPTQVAAAFEDIVDFERTLADDRYRIVKLFLHIGRKEQSKRLKRMESNPDTAWQVEPEDWHRNERYSDYLVAVEELLARTDTEWGPWTLIAATDRRWTRLRVFETLVRRIEDELGDAGFALPDAADVDASGEDDDDDDGLVDLSAEEDD